MPKYLTKSDDFTKPNANGHDNYIELLLYYKVVSLYFTRVLTAEIVKILKKFL